MVLQCVEHKREWDREIWKPAKYDGGSVGIKKNENGIKVERDCDRYMLVMYVGYGMRCEGKSSSSYKLRRKIIDRKLSWMSIFHWMNFKMMY